MSVTLAVTEVVPFLWVGDMSRSLAFYCDGLGFTLERTWEVEGRVRWCRLELGGAALMLQEYAPGRAPAGTPGVGMSLNFACDDALGLYATFAGRGLSPTEPFVGNAQWVTSLHDPDGFALFFSSPTDVTEETTLSEFQGGS